MQARLRHSLLDLARRLQSGGNADTVGFAIFRLQQINRHLVQSDRFNEVVHCISAVTVLLRPVYTGDFCRGNSMQFLSAEVATSKSHV